MADIAVRLGAEPARVHVIPNGVNARLFQPVPRAEARRRLGLDAARPLLVCVASLKRPKGQADLIRAARRTPREVHLALIGRAAGGRGYLRRLRALAGSLGLDGRVRFLGGVDRATVAAYLNAADVSILPSHCEGCPNVVLESLACGTPVVATTVGGVPDLIRPGATGLLVPPGDASALTSALLDALSGRWSRDVIRASVADRSWDSVAEKVLQVFRSAVACR